jgi:kinase-associated protein B
MTKIAIGDIVETNYNSGTYIAEVLEDKGNFALVKILAVLTHPMQGDLHQRGQVEGVAFHERKALAYEEKMNARKRQTIAFEGEVPDYATSLKEAVETYKQVLQQVDSPFNKMSLEKIADLEEHYYYKIYEQGSLSQ